jgi:hypothetical protein
MKIKKLFLILCAVAAITAVVITLTYDRIVIYFVAKHYDLDISYSKVKNYNFKELVFDDLRAMDRKRGSGIFALHAKLWPAIGIQAANSKALTFELKNVTFIPGKSPAAKSADHLMNLVSMPFSGKLPYKEISGDIVEMGQGIFIRKLSATGDSIMLSVNGHIYKNNNVDLNITIFFSKNILKDIPDTFTATVLKDEQGEWKSFTAHLTGDLSAPAIQISGKSFRLNIREINPNSGL